jgi:hypothetical protein
MPLAVEKLVRLMVMLPPDQSEPLWKSVAADCGDNHAEIFSIRWQVGEAARMWPEGAPRTLAEAVLTAFGDSSETTLRLLSEAILVRQGAGPQVGAVWAARACEAAIDVLAHADSFEDVLQQAKDKWSLRS